MKPHDRLCHIMFDEMKTKPGLAYYSKYDQIIGFENCGRNSSSQLAIHALVFMVHGIFKQWKQVIGIFLSNESASSTDLKHLVLEAIETMQKYGLNPLSVICIMSCNNQKLFSNKLEVTEDNPYFFYLGRKYLLYMTLHTF